MIRTLMSVTLLLMAGAQATNPRTGDPAAIRAGGAIFRERCADCHGADATGVRGPDLTRIWTTAASDERAFRIIRAGVPGSIMPPSAAPDEEIWAVVAYLRNISTAAAGTTARGEAVNGRRIFDAKCRGCHQVDGRGGGLGPDLSRIGQSLPRDAMTDAIRNASAAIAAGYEPMILTTRDGQRIRGARKGEDPFSIQIMDTRERLQGYLKSDLRDVARDSKSLMPDFAREALNDRDLDDLLAYLTTLRFDNTAGRP